MIKILLSIPCCLNLHFSISSFVFVCRNRVLLISYAQFSQSNSAANSHISKVNYFALVSVDCEFYGSNSYCNGYVFPFLF
ncbi:hypothetical protein DsansV1_C11g0105941 [Dioscorea sansibarensis]